MLVVIDAAVLSEVVGRAVGRIAGPRLRRLCRTPITADGNDV